MEESADDMTAADTAPSPKKETHSGVRYCKTNGKMSNALLGISDALKLSLVTYAVRFQSRNRLLIGTEVYSLAQGAMYVKHI